MLGRQIFSGDTHMANAKRIGQHGNHRVDGLGVTHPCAATQRRQQVSRLRHDFNTAADTVISIAEHQVLGGGDNTLQARGAETGNLHGDGIHRQASLNGSNAGNIGITGVRRHCGANGDVIDGERINP
ncbi:MAG: hypothetical protein ACD_10C00770G0001 [uncultured bacterium]|nr:MAG: hypothetical protein ACD_10C00770G0001 [uncultured bacterium]